ncbi:DNA primase family protein [Sphingomonas sp. KC8]|uniref:DNA primase family protein n=1 Tax=Sphingomonas sp. KC8 TaxID=1030157 RepID=UPI00024897B7|nr:phage/plasmid primase, P4 family [Sphingomonas sp. KC8]ARS29066.1 DNA primase [Sphingomonas sp. KC8]
MTDQIIPITIADPLVTAWLDTSDFGNGKRLMAVAAGRLLWIEDAQTWAFHDGWRWSIERGAIEAQRLAHKVIEHIDREAVALGEIAENSIALKDRVGAWCTPEIATKRVETLRGHAVRSGSAGMTSGMLKQARSFLAARLEDFDKNPLIYNTLNATLRFIEVDGRWIVKPSPHDPADMLMQVANVEYQPDADCPFWEGRLQMLTPDPEQLTAFKLLYGYSLTGLTSDQAFYVHQGKGGDGKSMTHQTLANIHGDYYRHAGVKTFLQGRDGGGAEHRSDLVRLKGDIRFVTCDEPKSRSVWDGETIKQVTGSLITARGANERTEITYRPRFKMHVECNIIPRAPSDDKGFRRRFKLYQWRVSLDDTTQGALPPDVVLAKLDEEKSGILNWLIAGACEWLVARKIPQPTAMTEVLSDFWADSSPLLEWMSEWCDTTDADDKESSKALYDHFKQWCEDGGREQVMTSTAFGRALRDKQHAVVKDHKGVRWRKGIKLRTHGIFAPGATAGPLPAEADQAPEPAVPIDPFDEDDLPP